MNVKFYKPARLLSFVLAATVALGPTALAADVASLNEQNVVPAVVNEQDAPVVVSNLVTGTALGLGSVEVLGVNVRANPTTDADIVTTLAQGQQVLVLSKDGDWYRVSCDGVSGFVHSDYMSVAAEGTAELGYGLVKCAAANVRQAPSVESDPIDCVGQEEAVSITGISDGWYQVSVDGTEGYVRSDLVDPTAEIPAEKIYDYAVIQCAAANLRSEPDSSSSRTDVLYNGSLCTLLQQVGDWYQVQYGNTTGYILASLVDVTNSSDDGSSEIETLNDIVAREEEEAAAEAEEAAKQPTQEETTSSDDTSYEDDDSYEDDTSYEDDDTYEDDTSYEDDDSYDDDTSYDESSYDSDSSSDIVSVAMKYLGVPYVWGGTTPSGFDCSGFVQYVFRECGYSISRTATPQYDDGYYVAYSDLQPGDLVFFERTYNDTGITHVGIYIGGGDFIHAGSGAVKISSLSESYYSSRYYGACRIA